MGGKTMVVLWNCNRLLSLPTRVPLLGMYHHNTCQVKLSSFVSSRQSVMLQNVPSPGTITPRKNFSQSSLPVQPKTLEDCYQLFCVDEFCTIEELRSAYEITTKSYSGNIDDVHKIHQAYYRIMKSWSRMEQSRKVEPQSKYLLNPQPMHKRAYLRYEGVGYEGQKEENSSSAHSKAYTSGRKASMSMPGSKSISVDTMVERLVQLHGADKQEMIEDLPGFGKPLPKEYEHPYTDSVQAKLNKIMINSDVGTEWMELKKDFQEELKLAKLRLQSCHDSIQRQPRKPGNRQKWDQAIADFKIDIKNVNKKVDSYNLSVPMMYAQRMPFNAEKELNKLQQQWTQTNFEKEQNSVHDSQASLTENTHDHDDSTGFFNSIKRWIYKS